MPLLRLVRLPVEARGPLARDRGDHVLLAEFMVTELGRRARHLGGGEGEVEEIGIARVASLLGLDAVGAAALVR